MSSLPSWTSYFWITQNGCQQTCWNQTLVKNSTCLQQRDGSWWLPQMFLKCSAALVSFPKVLHASSSLGEGRVGTWPSDIRWGRRRKQYYVTESWFLSLEAAGLWFGILLLSPSFTSSRLHSKVYRPCLEAHGASVTRSTVPVQCSTQRQRGTHTTSVTLRAALVWHTKHCQCDRAGTQDRAGGGGLCAQLTRAGWGTEKHSCGCKQARSLSCVHADLGPRQLAERQAHCFTPKMVWARCRRVELAAWNAELGHGKSKLDNHSSVEKFHERAAWGGRY